MNDQPKKWKRGDIGPDGRVFWCYGKQYRNGERWITREKSEENRVKLAEQSLRRYKKNRDKAVERMRRYNEKNRDQIAERKRRYREENCNEIAEKARQYREKKLDKIAERKRRSGLKKAFSKATVSTISEFYDTFRLSIKLAVIANLTPDPGQTLAELIHELSGYPMHVCEQIANPPDPEPEKLDNPPANDTLAGGPDLF
jgi:hypothetical protein